MKAKKRNINQASFFFDFEDMLDQNHPLYILSHKVNWDLFEKSFSSKYSKNIGRPAKPILLMVGLLILKHIRNITDESVVEQWSEKSILNLTAKYRNSFLHI